MRALLLLNLNTIRSKYWFIPSIMALGAMGLAFAAVALDRHAGGWWIERVPWLSAAEPPGARALLSVIAGSMITVAGVTFSVTMVALATTASTFGPRLISNFMQDRGNQVTLGTFIATFLYCVVVMRTVRSGGATADFVPHVAVTVALLFALASLGVLIYFIHHVPDSIHLSNVIARLGREFHSQIDRTFPGNDDEAGNGGAGAGPRDTPGAEDFASVRARADGYVQYVDVEGLLKSTLRHDLIVEVVHPPGEFVREGDALARVGPRARAGGATGDDVRRAIVIGGYRSQEQDLLYLVNRLVEVAARALSPGMNDIFTATNAMDWLGAGLRRLAARGMAGQCRRDEAGRPRVVMRERTFEEVADAIFDQLRPYVAADRNAALHLMHTLATVSPASHERRAVMQAHAKALHRAAVDSCGHPRDVEAIEAAYGLALEALTSPTRNGEGGGLQSERRREMR